MLALAGADSETVNLSVSNTGLWLGATPAGTTFSGLLTPANSTYQLGGGGGVLTVSTALGGNNSLVAFGGGGSGTLILTGPNNTPARPRSTAAPCRCPSFPTPPPEAS